MSEYASGMVVTPDDEHVLENPPQELRIGRPGHLAVQFVDKTVLVIPHCQKGETLRIRVRKIYRTGTSAGHIVGFV